MGLSSYSLLKPFKLIFSLRRRGNESKDRKKGDSKQHHIILCGRCKQTFTPNPPNPSVPTPILHSDYVPTDEERARTFSLLAEKEQELARYDAEMARIRRALKHMRAGKADIQKRIAERRNLVSAKRRIPVEVWEEIFSYTCFGSGHLQGARYSFRVDGKPFRLDLPTLALSHVSFGWRNLVINCPRLWSNFSVDLYGIQLKGIHEGRTIVYLLNLYLHRSAGHPLGIRIVDTNVGTHTYRSEQADNLTQYYLGETGYEVFRLLMGETNRCQVLELELDWILLTDIDDRPTSFPILQSFRNSIEFPVLVLNDIDWFCEAIHASPKLTYVRTMAPLLNWHIHPYSQLTELAFDELDDTGDVYEALASCLNLKSLFINSYIPGEDEIAGPITLPKLQHLTIQLSDTLNEYSILFQSLILSSLTSMHFSTLDCVQFMMGPSFLGLLRRSVMLKKLSLRIPGVSLASESISTALKSIPKLEHLTLVIERHTRLTTRLRSNASAPVVSLVRQLTANWDSHSSSPLCPHLKQILISHPDFSPISGRYLVEMVVSMAESRSPEKVVPGRDVARLETLCLSFSSPYVSKSDIYSYIDEILRERLDVLKQAGMRCLICAQR